MKTVEQRVIEILSKRDVIRPRDLDEYGIRREYLSRLYKQGVLHKDTRGIYHLSNASLTENHAIATACKQVPHGVICLLSALRFHDIGTQNPPDVWTGIAGKAWCPKLAYPTLKIVRFSDSSLTTGIEEHEIEGVQVKVFSPAKTIADCFKYRNKIGLDVFLEAARECLVDRRCNYEEIWHYAKVCRIRTVIKPYLEAMA